MAKVYVINNRHHNFDSASKYGELVYVTEGVVPIFKTDYVALLLQEKLKDFNIEEDFILACGPSIVGIMATLIVARRTTGKLKVLIFDAKDQSYVARHLPI